MAVALNSGRGGTRSASCVLSQSGPVWEICIVMSWQSEDLLHSTPLPPSWSWLGDVHLVIVSSALFRLIVGSSILLCSHSPLVKLIKNFAPHAACLGDGRILSGRSGASIRRSAPWIRMLRAAPNGSQAGIGTSRECCACVWFHVACPNWQTTRVYYDCGPTLTVLPRARSSLESRIISVNLAKSAPKFAQLIHGYIRLLRNI